MHDDDDDNATRIDFSERNPEKDPIKEVDLRARKRMSNDSKLSYRDATRAVFMDDEVLHRAYLDTTPPVHLKK